MHDLSTSILETPIGPLVLRADRDAVREVRFANDARPAPETTRRTGPLRELERELKAYFRGRVQKFETPCEPLIGTEFQRQVWNALRGIPFGETRSYGEIAEQIGRPSAVRAVGAANGRNPIPILVPCHRVVGSNRSLTGFGGGLEAKKALLELEGLEVDSRGQSLAREPMLPFGASV
ncbi:MAG: methylated-DNA--[protein]-cysteine S-methyltransferase [Planctomycetota bacterium]